MRTDTVVFSLLQHALDAANLRQAVYANNLANAETPGYQREDVSFEDVLQPMLESLWSGQGLSQSGSDALVQAAAVQPQIISSPPGVEMDNSGNSVDIDAEMADLATNQVRYNALAEDVQLRLARLRTAITGQ
ncbi:MAG: flagellar basal body rod protein FlgB [Thermoflavifilum sp.]|nr:flagellar basal body rod protein FlgB [Thermoflavifilum sp.]MCL6513375.1 flagellar basal body rod protein FlgB [Alicyclobacillus sp.]